MTNYDPPYKTLFFVCYSTVAAIVATEAGLLGDSDSYAANQSYEAFGEEWHLVNEEEHPWCGFGRPYSVAVLWRLQLIKVLKNNRGQESFP